MWVRNDPDYSSVTRLFYEAGWRGINVEPVATMFEKAGRSTS